MSNRKKNVLITGATKGIGKALALSLLEQGYFVILNYCNDDLKAKETLNECLKVNEAYLLKADVSNKSEVDTMFKSIVEKFGIIDAVINNAGLNIDKPFLDITEYDWDKVVGINMKGVFLVSQASAKIMMQQNKKGHIINIAATTGIQGRTNGINYCASKAAVINMTKCMAMELGPNINVNCVMPGFTLTDETEERFDLKNRLDEELELRAIPLKRIGQPVDIANIISFLLSDAASYINGQKIIIDGGEFMY